ncbi:MAG: FHA domain-containing protein [Actinomycetota bacterium]
MAKANELTCAHCGAAHGPDDIFCENCGYDFITGSLPGPAEGFGPGAQGATPAAPASAPAPTAGAAPTPAAEGAPAAPSPSSDPATPAAAAGGTPAAGQPAPGSTPPSLFPDAAPAAPATGSGPVAQPPTQPTAMPGSTLVIEIAVDRDYFDSVVSEGELSFPDPPASSQRLELAGPEIHIGRSSQGRAIHPDIDVQALTGDPAVSSRHAVIRVDPSGAVTITDVGSTNGTYVGSFDGDPVTVGVATLMPQSGTVYLGAWTSLKLQPAA